MAKEVNPQETTRAKAFELWMKAPNPMVTFFKTLDVTNLVRFSKRRGLKFNMLLDYCIGKAAPSGSGPSSRAPRRRLGWSLLDLLLLASLTLFPF